MPRRRRPTASLPPSDVRFLVDEQLPPALARWLAAEGHDAQHVLDVGLQGARDRDIWNQATTIGAVIVTKDADFVEKAKRGGGAPVVWITMGNCRKQELLDRFQHVLPQVTTALEAGENIVELR